MPDLTITTERVDDIPLLIAHQQRLGIVEAINAVYVPHGNRKGLSLGALLATWLSFILSRQDHRMVRVEPWAQQQQRVLGRVLGEGVTASDFTDDRLADGLRALSDDARFQQLETRLGSGWVRVYGLTDSVIRLDTTTAALYHDRDQTVLFRKGQSKDHRPDLAQVKLMLGALDPLGLPIATVVAAGNAADDGLYRPVIARVRAVVGAGSHLYVGDSKMAARSTRADVASGGDWYLMPDAHASRGERMRPWIEAACRKQVGIERVWDEAQEVASTEAADRRRPRVVAIGYERVSRHQVVLDKATIEWDERVLVVYSPHLARQQRRTLAQHVAAAEAELAHLTPPRGPGRRQYEQEAPLRAAATAIVRKHRVEGILEVRTEPEQPPAAGAARAQRLRYQLSTTRDAVAWQRARRLCGWRVYVTNAPREKLSFAEAVRVYRGSSRIEHNFSRLKNKPLGLRPFYVQREDHVVGLMRLLTLGLSVLTSMEFTAREALKAATDPLLGLVVGAPKRATPQPTTERLLEAFSDLYLTVIESTQQRLLHLTPLSVLQRRVLSLLGFEASIYETIAGQVDPIPP